MEKIILESKFTLFQKILLSGASLLFFGIGYKIWNHLIVDKYGDPVEISLVWGVLSFLLALSLFLFLFVKDGLCIDNHTIYKAWFLGKKLVFKQKVDLDDITDISIFKIKTKENIEFYRPGPQTGEFSHYYYKIFLLNDRHTYKELLIESENEEKILYIADVLQTKTGLKLNDYNPRF
jgi:hypothetical protein